MDTTLTLSELRSVGVQVDDVAAELHCSPDELDWKITSRLQDGRDTIFGAELARILPSLNLDLVAVIAKRRHNTGAAPRAVIADAVTQTIEALCAPHRVGSDPEGVAGACRQIIRWNRRVFPSSALFHYADGVADLLDSTTKELIAAVRSSLPAYFNGEHPLESVQELFNADPALVEIAATLHRAATARPRRLWTDKHLTLAKRLPARSWRRLVEDAYAAPRSATQGLQAQDWMLTLFQSAFPAVER